MPTDCLNGAPTVVQNLDLPRELPHMGGYEPVEAATPVDAPPIVFPSVPTRSRADLVAQLMLCRRAAVDWWGS